MKTTATKSKTKKKTPKGINFPLLEKFIEKAERFPKAINMGVWGRTAIASKVHPCGTIGCLAGHVTLETSPEIYWEWVGMYEGPVLPDHKWARYQRIHPAKVARRALGITLTQSNRLFHPEYWPQPFRDQYDAAQYGVGKTKITIARVRHFIKTEGRE